MTSVSERKTDEAVRSLAKRFPDEIVYLQITVKKNPGKGLPLPKVKRLSAPYLIPIPHRARPKKLSDMTICLVVKDPQAKYKKVLEDDTTSPTHDLFAEIVSVTKLRSRLAALAAASHSKKSPLDPHNFDLIFVQSNVSHLLPDIVDPKLYATGKTVPIPMQIDGNDISPKQVLQQVRRIVNRCTTLVVPSEGSTCFSVLVGTIGNTPQAKLVDNINSAIDNIVTGVPSVGGWDNVIGIHIKTANSISLPIL